MIDEEVLRQIQDEDAAIEHLYCGHCGSINDVREVDLIEAKRHLCVKCREQILKWV